MDRRTEMETRFIFPEDPEERMNRKLELIKNWFGNTISLWLDEYNTNIILITHEDLSLLLLDGPKKMHINKNRISS